MPRERLKSATRAPAEGPLLKGSLAEVELTCGSPGCRCRRGGPRHKGHYFSYQADGRGRTVYVPQAVVEEARRAHAEWLALKRRLEERTAETVAWLREEASRRRSARKGGRDDGRSGSGG